MNLLKKISLKWKLIVSVVLIAVFTSSPVIMANDTEVADEKCVIAYRDYLRGSGKQFMDTIQAHFNNPSSTTTLLPKALEKFNAYKTMIAAKRLVIQKEVVDKFKLKIKTQGELLAQFKDCQNEEREHNFIMDEIIRDHIRRNAQSKRTYIFLQEYKRINSKMGDLNRQVGQMRGYFKIFRDKLTNFVPHCVQQ